MSSVCPTGVAVRPSHDQATVCVFDLQARAVSSDQSKKEGKRSLQGGGAAPASKKVKT